jgi:hypothetical protein
MSHTAGHGEKQVMLYISIMFKRLPLSLTVIGNAILIANRCLHSWKEMVGSDGHT